MKFELGRVSKTKPHLLADSAEIDILFGDRDIISQDDLVSLIQQSDRPGDELLGLTVEDLDDNNERDDLGEIEISSRLQSRVEDAFVQLQFRVDNFGDFYPFYITQEGVLTRVQHLTDSHLIYVILIICSRTRSFKKKGITQKIGDQYEVLCKECLKQLVSPLSKVYMFGPNSTDRKRIFGTNIRTAIPILAKKIGMSLVPGWENNHPSGNGDFNMDLIATFDFDEPSNSNLVVIAQCASSEDTDYWKRKRMESDIDYKTGTFGFLNRPQSMLFIPVCYRQANGAWVNENDVAGGVTIDRLRTTKTFELSARHPEPLELFEAMGVPRPLDLERN